MIVLFDEVDLPWGMLRIRERGSAGGAQRPEVDHRVARHGEFIRVRLGVEAGIVWGDMGITCWAR